MNHSSPIRRPAGRFRAFAMVAFLVAVGGGFSADSAWAQQCGNYVIMLDEQGEPIVAASHAMPDVKRFPLAELAERTSVPTRPMEVPCDGIHCRDDHGSMVSPPPPVERRPDGAPTFGTSSNARLNDDVRSRPFYLSESRPCAGHPTSLLKPPEVR